VGVVLSIATSNETPDCGQAQIAHAYLSPICLNSGRSPGIWLVIFCCIKLFIPLRNGVKGFTKAIP